MKTKIVKTKRIRDVVFTAHRYIGLAIGILAAAIGMTGSLLIVHDWQTSLAETIAPVGEFYKDYALLGQHLFSRAKMRKAMQESVAACNKAISLAPSSGDGYMCRAFPLAALGSKVQTVKDVNTAKTLFQRSEMKKKLG